MCHIVAVFREVKRVLRDDGTVFLNLGDSYAANSNRGGGKAHSTLNAKRDENGIVIGKSIVTREPSNYDLRAYGLKPKDLLMMPARVALALQADGWWLRSDIVWAKSNPMPESVTDRPTRSHEYIFLLSKSERYFYDADAIREPQSERTLERFGLNGSRTGNGPKQVDSPNGMIRDRAEFAKGMLPNGRNKRDVWTVNSEPTPEAHFATFPRKLIEPCILAGTSERGCCSECGAPWARVTETANRSRSFKDNGKGIDQRKAEGSGGRAGSISSITTGWRRACSHDAPSVPCLVFDPFIGSGTTGIVCERFGRRWVGLDLSFQYLSTIATRRTAQRGLRFAGAE